MNNELYHHGILGQKWGVRRFQNKDGSYTAAGKKNRNKHPDESKQNKKHSIDGKKIVTGVLTSAALASYAYLILSEPAQSTKVVDNSELNKRKIEKAFAEMYQESQTYIDSMMKMAKNTPNGSIKFSDMTMDDLRKMDLY